MEFLGAAIIGACLWFAQSKTEKKPEKPQKKPDITVEIYDHRNKRLDS